MPAAILQHKGNATSIKLSDAHVYYYTRNLELVWIKNMPAGLMFRFAHHKLFHGDRLVLLPLPAASAVAPVFRAKRDALKMLWPIWKKDAPFRRGGEFPTPTSDASMFTLDFARQKMRQLIQG